jgi:ornithine cyclodeaminase/alanine dehydrogenase-like protein (mu-crystallin family)
VFDAAWIRPGTHVNGIGAFRLGMVELPPQLFARASLVAVDSREAASAEAGDVMEAVKRGHVDADDLVEIGSVDPTWSASRDDEAITAFKSVGLAIQDVAATELVVRRVLGDVGGGPP